jgi:hypothetical protein
MPGLPAPGMLLGVDLYASLLSAPVGDCQLKVCRELINCSLTPRMCCAHRGIAPSSTAARRCRRTLRRRTPCCRALATTTGDARSSSIRTDGSNSSSSCCGGSGGSSTSSKDRIAALGCREHTTLLGSHQNALEEQQTAIQHMLRVDVNVKVGCTLVCANLGGLQHAGARDHALRFCSAEMRTAAACKQACNLSSLKVMKFLQGPLQLNACANRCA